MPQSIRIVEEVDQLDTLFFFWLPYMFDIYLREFKDRLVLPLVHLFVCFSPTSLTLVSFFFGLLCSLAILYDYNYITCLSLWWLNRIFGGWLVLSLQRRCPRWSSCKTHKVRTQSNFTNPSVPLQILVATLISL